MKIPIRFGILPIGSNIPYLASSLGSCIFKDICEKYQNWWFEYLKKKQEEK